LKTAISFANGHKNLQTVNFVRSFRLRRIRILGSNVKSWKQSKVTTLRSQQALPFFLLSIAVLTSPQLPSSVSQLEQVTALPCVALYGIANSSLPHFWQGDVMFNSPMGILSIQV